MSVPRLGQQMPKSFQLKRIKNTWIGYWAHRQRLQQLPRPSPILSKNEKGKSRTPASGPLKPSARLPVWVGDDQLPRMSPAAEGAGLMSADASAVGKENSKVLSEIDHTVQTTYEKDHRFWLLLFKRMQRDYSDTGVWTFFRYLQGKGETRVLFEPGLHGLRDEIVVAAVASDTRIQEIVELAREACSQDSQVWPDLYLMILYALLSRKSYDGAIIWHMRLYHEFPPGPDVLAALLSNFVVDTSPEMQSCLTALYDFNTGRNFYDRIVPVLWEAGLSKEARDWRFIFCQREDHPSSSASRPYLHFLRQYYPTIKLTEQEHTILELKPQPFLDHQSRQSEVAAVAERYKRPEHWLSSVLHQDDLLAKWFASSFIPPELAINLVHRLGLVNLGLRSFQALVLRESDAEGVVARLSQLERLGVQIPSQNYAKALVFFAKKGDDELLRAVAESDVHPVEFDSADKRDALHRAAKEQGDRAKQRLFEGIEEALGHSSTRQRLNDDMGKELQYARIGKAMLILDRMKTQMVEVTPENADGLLFRVFLGLTEHPAEDTRLKEDMSRAKRMDVLNRAIRVVRTVASPRYSVSTELWRKLLLNLGRLGRFKELEQLSIEVCQLWSPSEKGLLLVHGTDLPEVSKKDASKVQRPKNSAPSAYNNLEWDAPQPNNNLLEYENVMSEGSHDHARVGQKRPRSSFFIPADMPFTHRQHPIQKLFDPKMQRSILRWVYDNNLSQAPSGQSQVPTNLDEYDVAGGVRLLALLRDQGVCIAEDLVRSAMINRIAVGEVSGRSRHRARGGQEDYAYVKQLIDEAWGSEIMPAVTQLEKRIGEQQPKLWKRYDLNFLAHDPEASLERQVVEERDKSERRERGRDGQQKRRLPKKKQWPV